MKKSLDAARPASALGRGKLGLFVAAGCLAWVVPTALAGSPDVVISQVYGGGGASTGSPSYKYDYVELFNRGTVDRSLNGWSLQYGSATGNSWSNRANFPPDAVIKAGSYYLVRLSSAGTAGGDLPLVPDFSSTSISMSATNGKIALVRSTVSMLNNTNPFADATEKQELEDFVGYGTANGSETTATAALSTTTAAIRNDPCVDTDSNISDFTVTAPNLHNSQTTLPLCPGPYTLAGSGEAVPGTVGAGETVTLSVTVQPASDPASTDLAVTADLSLAGGSAIQAFTVSPTNPNEFTYSLTITCAVANGIKILPVTIADGQSRTAAANIALTTTAANTVITLQPSDAIICPGGTAVFVVKATGGGLNYVWRNNSGPITTDTRITTVTSADGTSSALRIADVTPADVTAGPYSVVVSGTCGTPATSNSVNILSTGAPATDLQRQVVISQVYGGGGNSGATLTNDYIELFNRGPLPVDISGWTVQYASVDAPTGSAPEFDNPPRFTLVPAGTRLMQPGEYFLIQESAGAGGTTPLPTADVNGVARPEGPILIGSAGGKVALVNNATPLAGLCPGGGVNPTACGIVDFVAWSSDPVSCSEGTPAAGTSNTTAIMRVSACVDTDDNGADFIVGTPNPHNHATAVYPVINTQPTNQTACLGRKAVFSVVADGACLQYQWQSAPGGTTDFVDVTIGTGAQSATYTTGELAAEDDGRLFRVVVSNQFTTTPVPSGGATLTLTSPGPTPEEKQVVISQIYGSGGLTGAFYNSDFIELFNRGTAPVDLNGWSVQYASAEGTSWSNKVDLTGTIYPGQYYVIQGAPDVVGVGLPWPPQQTSTLNLSSLAGKVALVHSNTAMSSRFCANTCAVVDFVGYGSTANCFEGTGPAPYQTAGATFGTVRTNSFVDTDDNAADFQVAEAKPRLMVVDFNNDGKVNQADYDVFALCFTGPDVPFVNLGCAAADVDGDLDVDVADFGLFQRCYSGDTVASPSCLVR